ncbi:Geranylgeranyl transferase type I subunit beta [Hyphodiscus hymeniophilus]|uniref:Geranylgeranyl transferase type I subunit beta n=1 Tax=Hyphodiscus hymeniophilus TaxID=353542 RepID=A0A9P6VNC1_9HELO|nr:Geranylgeranyl transferase type I subunit beta [Hyphodiscus hymeniophilus]
MGELKLDKERHIKYWLRCLRTVLPTAYTSTDSSRMTLGFFILTALDLLGADAPSAEERKDIQTWILKCQHPNGGFCGSPNHRYPDGYYVDVGQGKRLMDPANLPATYFAILSLSFVAGFDGLMRGKCLRWLKTLQREDGSFGELVTEDGTIQGGRDMRYCYVATAIRWMLRGGGPSKEEQKEDIDVEKLVDHIRSGQTYDGGISESTTHEAHAGYTYCAIAALSLLDRLPGPSASQTASTPNGPSNVPLPGLTNFPATIGWLVSRQTGYSTENNEDDNENHGDILPIQDQRNAMAGTHTASAEVLSLAELSLKDDQFVGFNGRCNKKVDTCYAFWVGASLDIAGHPDLINLEEMRRFLFEQTQHMIGGFGKTPGDPPDIYHSSLGLAALAAMKEPSLKGLDPALCISIDQREQIVRLRNEALRL